MSVSWILFCLQEILINVCLSEFVQAGALSLSFCLGPSLIQRLTVDRVTPFLNKKCPFGEEWRKCTFPESDSCLLIFLENMFTQIKIPVWKCFSGFELATSWSKQLYSSQQSMQYWGIKSKKDKYKDSKEMEWNG